MSPSYTVLDEFEQLTAALLDGSATPSEQARFNEIAKDYPEFRSVWLEQVRLHALLSCRGGGRFGGRSGHTGRFAGAGAPVAGIPAETSKCARTAPAPLARTAQANPIAPARFSAPLKWRLAGAAAAAAVLLAGGLWWRDAPPSSTIQTPACVSPVQVLCQRGASGLELPAALPGALRLDNGLAVVRLASGVQLTLLGPVSLEACDVMRVRLESGRLLADVPPAASGFTVLTAELEVYDLGTIFGVSAWSGRSDAFVFKGNVQVNEASGEAVGLCEAGEGVCALPGKRPVKVAADWPEARKIFHAARGEAALADPTAAFEVADRVADLWLRRYMPTVVPPPPPPVPGLRGGKPLAVNGKQSAVGLRQPSLQGISNHTAMAARTAAPQQKESEMRGMTNTAAALAAAVTMGAGAAYAVPAVSNVQMAQRAGSRVVDITYDLAGEAAIITLGIETNGVAIPDAAVTSLSGDVSVVIQPGTGRHIVWNAGADWPEKVAQTAKARVTAWSVDAPPQYCAVDVTGGPSTNSYPVYYYVSADGVPGGVTNELYKTVLILLRRIGPTGGEGFLMGSPVSETGRITAREKQVRAWLTKGFYAGVYEVTQGQWYQVMGNTAQAWPSMWSNKDYWLTRPVDQVSYYDIRENIANTDDLALDWPATDTVTADSFMGRLRSKTGLAGFDLPTEAQWEYACRSGTTGALNDGTVNLITNSNTDARLDKLGRYQYNGGKIVNGTTDPLPSCATANATAAVGSYQPNAWGLYDMHGNVWEWCLDWYADTMEGGEDPDGADSGSSRVTRGGSWYISASSCRSADRHNNVPAFRNYCFGFRIVRTLP